MVVHQLCTHTVTDLKLTNGTIIYLPYKQFAVGPASEQYQLTTSGFTGYSYRWYISHASDTYSYYSFKVQDTNCPKINANFLISVHNGRGGGWWFNRCVHIYFLTISSYNYIRAINLNDHWPSLALMEIKSDQQTVPDIKCVTHPTLLGTLV